MSLTLTAVDNGSRSITVAITSSSPPLATSTPISILASKWNGSAGAQGWTALGTVLYQDTTLTVTLPSFGPYFLAATVPSVAGYYSNPFYLPVVDASLSLFTQCENAIVATIQALNLTSGDDEIGDIGDKVYGQLLPHELTLDSFPACLVVSDEGLEKLDEALASTNLMSNVGHPFRCIMGIKLNLNQDKVRPVLSKWRQTVRRCFDKTRLPGVPSAPWTQVEFGPRFAKMVYQDGSGASELAYETIATILTIRASTREPRGFLA